MKAPLNKVLLYGLFFTIFSMLIEVILITFLQLSVAQNAGVMGIILLLLAPYPAAKAAGIRQKALILPLYAITIFLMLILTALFGQTVEGGVFGPATGLIKPFILRFPAGIVAAYAAYLLKKN